MKHKCPQQPPEQARDLPTIDGCSCAIIGTTQDRKVAYSYQLLVEHFIHKFQTEGDIDDYDDDFHTQAIEYVDYNIVKTCEALGNPFVIVYDLLD